MGMKGSRLKFLGRKSFFLNEGGEEYQIEGNFIHPCIYLLDKNLFYNVVFTIDALLKQSKTTSLKKKKLFD